MYMKNLLTTVLILTFFFLPFTFSLAQTDELEISPETDVEFNIPTSQEDNNEEAEDTQEQTDEERESLAESLQQQEVEQIQAQSYSFWTILGAILIPSIFIILAYLILKSFQT